MHFNAATSWVAYQVTENSYLIFNCAYFNWHADDLINGLAAALINVEAAALINWQAADLIKSSWPR